MEGPGRGSRIGQSNAEKSTPSNGSGTGAGAETLEGDLRGAC